MKKRSPDRAKWKPVVGYETLYTVSRAGEVWSNYRGRLLRPVLDRMGYRSVIFCDGTGKMSVRTRISVIVLSAFVGPRPRGLEAAHLNGIKTDDRLLNLEWVTRSENLHHRQLHKTHKRGERITDTLNDNKIHMIRKLLASGWPHARIARRFFVATSTISEVCAGRTWAHVK